MALSDRLQTTAQKLITEYGNTSTLVKKITGDKVYDPVLDDYVGTDESVSFTTKCTYKEQTVGEVYQDNSGKLLRVAVIPYATEIANLDTTWTLDGNKIYRVEPTELQDTVVVFKAYVG